MRRDTYFLGCGMHSMSCNMEGYSKNDKNMGCDSFAIFS